MTFTPSRSNNHVGLTDSSDGPRLPADAYGRFRLHAGPGCCNINCKDKAAALLESLVRNPGLAEGNKRLGWLSVVVFYGLNDIILEAPDDDSYDLVIAIASGTISYQDAADQLASWH